mmetsp:Transcript_2592/g.5635  ORF Transcript_2592/g.5635 Transcript_2592/m.5635 type:complete len:137 (-) Transcript_2592:816-1226(-)
MESQRLALFMLEVALEGMNRSEIPTSIELKAKLPLILRRDEDRVVVLVLLVLLLMVVLLLLILLGLLMLLLLTKGEFLVNRLSRLGDGGNKNRPGNLSRVVRIDFGRKIMFESPSKFRAASLCVSIVLDDGDGKGE